MARLKLDLWKANPKGGGGAAIFEYNPDKQKLFVSMRSQIGTDKAFEKDKTKHLVTALDLPDLGEILLVLSGRKAGLGQQDGEKFKGLYHTYGDDGNNTIISLTSGERGFFFGLSVKRDGNTSKQGIPLSWGEGETLRVFIEHVMTDMFVDTWTPGGGETVEDVEAKKPVKAKASGSAKKTKATETVPPEPTLSDNEDVPF